MGSRLYLILFFVLGLSGISSTLTGCAGKAVDENDPAAMMKEAEEEIKSDHYQLAIDKLKIIKNKFPYSALAVDAQLRLADVFYLQESYGEAAAAYESFRDLHPKHPKTPFAMFRIGKSYFNDIPSPVARDLTTANKCLDAYHALLKRFPDAPEAAEAKSDVASARKLLADKELYIADFYYKRGFYTSAGPRYRKIVETFPDTDASHVAKIKLETIEKMPKAPAQEGSPAGSKDAK